MIMRRCRTCCYPDTKPDLHFDSTGQCSACTSYLARKTTDWEGRTKALLELLDRHDGRVIVGSSGGKDSTYICLRLKELGADVTAVTATTCHLTPVGRRNLDNLARHVRTIEVTPNMSVRAKLNRFALSTVGDISWPEHASIFSVPFRVAAQTGIKLIMYGENPQEAYGGPPGTEQAHEMTRRWVSEFGGFNGLRPSDFVGVAGVTERDMADYRLPSAKDLDGVEAHFLGQYEQWDSHHNAMFAADRGFYYIAAPCAANWWTFENLDNAQTGLHDYFMYLKYGYGRGCAQISVDVRSGFIARMAALDWLSRHDGVFPITYCDVPLANVLDRIEMGNAEFCDIAKRFTERPA